VVSLVPRTTWHFGWIDLERAFLEGLPEVLGLRADDCLVGSERVWATSDSAVGELACLEEAALLLASILSCRCHCDGRFTVRVRPCGPGLGWTWLLPR